MNNTDYDVVIVGGGPAGSTLGVLLRKYQPETRVLILEREVFPRDHVGESLLPAITPILAEMGCWEKIEGAGFPVKTGAMYRWGSTDDLWRLDFLVGEEFQNNARPEPLEGQRWRTTFHVERSIFDEILLDHAAEYGCEVREGAKVTGVERDGDRVVSLTLDGGTKVTGKYIVDASGHVGFLRRQMGVGVNEPTRLKNIAVWDYWTKPEWAESVCRPGVRVRIFSLGTGWIWFIPLSTTRASVGYVTHAEHYKSLGVSPKEMYLEALAQEPFLAKIMPGAESEGRMFSTKDWSFTADRIVGENWFLVGESAGFADPILAAGLTLAMVGARDLAHVIANLIREEHDPEWLRNSYEELSLRRLNQHIRFADYWYSANAHFTDLKKYTSEIAKDAGLELDPDQAFQWLSTGGFASDMLESPVVGTYELGPVKAVLQQLTGKPVHWKIAQNNEFRLNLGGAQQVVLPKFRDGRVEEVRCYRRGNKLLPLTGVYREVFNLINNERDAMAIMATLRRVFPSAKGTYHPAIAIALDAIEGMIAEGWITAKVNKKRPLLKVAINEASLAVTAEHDPDSPEASGQEVALV